MDNRACAVVYLDRQAGTTGLLSRQTLQQNHDGHRPIDTSNEHAARNIETLIAAFGQGNLSPTSSRLGHV